MNPQGERKVELIGSAGSRCMFTVRVPTGKMSEEQSRFLINEGGFCVQYVLADVYLTDETPAINRMMPRGAGAIGAE